jgi:hypothetical protein
MRRNLISKKKVQKRRQGITEEEYLKYTSEYLDYVYEIGEKVVWVSSRTENIRVGDKGYIVSIVPYLGDFSCYSFASHNRDSKATEPRIRSCLAYEIVPDDIGNDAVKKYAMFFKERGEQMFAMIEAYDKKRTKKSYLRINASSLDIK